MSTSADDVTKKARRVMTRIDSFRATDIARKFFEQYHTGVEVKDLELKDDVWLITVGVGFLSEQIRKIEIDANTGKIIHCR